MSQYGSGMEGDSCHQPVGTRGNHILERILNLLWLN